MTDVAAQISELEELVGQIPANERTKALGQIIDLFLQNVGRYSGDVLDLFGTIIQRFLRESGPETLTALSGRLAPVAKAPTQVIRHLASHDDIAVAEPVLMQSPDISDLVLCEIARTKGQSHQLAIACRPTLSAAVTDALLRNGDDVVVRYAFTNAAASFSPAGRKMLVERSKNDGMLADMLKQRRDFA